MSGSMAEIAQMAAVPVTEAVPAGAADLLTEFRSIEAELGQTAPAETTADVTKAPEKTEAKPEKPEKPESDGKPTVKERAAFREERREFKRKAAEHEQKLNVYHQQLEQRAAQIEAALKEADDGSPKKLRAMFENGQLDDFVKALGIKDVDSWEKANDHAARLYASPEYRRVRELEQKQKQLEDKHESEKAEQARQVAAWRQEQAQLQYAANEAAAIVELGEALKNSSNQAVSILCEDSDFTRAVLRTIQSSPDLDVEEAADVVMNGDPDGKITGRKSVGARKRAELMAKAFGFQVPQKPEAGKPASPVRAGRPEQLARPNKHVSRTTASEASPPSNENLTDEQWMALGIEEMRKASRADEEVREKRRG